MQTKDGFAYLCTEGHIDLVPSMGTYASCQYLVPVRSRRGNVGTVPCGCAVVRVADPDGSLEAAFRIGGTQAVQSIVAARVRDEASPAAPAQRR